VSRVVLTPNRAPTVRVSLDVSTGYRRRCVECTVGFHTKSTFTMADLFGDDGEDDMLPEEEDEEEEDILDMEGDTGKHQKDSLLMRFCPHDSSMLYPQVRASFTWYHIVSSVHMCSCLKKRKNL
jgi:hypothetical protein